MSTYLTERYLRLPDGTLPHLGVRGGGDVAPCVLLTGNPDRLERMKALLSGAREVGRKRGYLVYTGRYAGVPVTVATSGLGAPSVAISVEELSLAGAQVFIRVGSCASIQPHVPIGSVIIATAAVRDEGASHAYAPAIFPAVADPDVVAALRAAAAEAAAPGTAVPVTAVPYHLGVIRSTDSFYQGERRAEIIDQWRALRVLAFEMESSALFTVAASLGCRGGSILVPGSNLVTGGATYQGQQVEAYTAGMAQAIAVALAAVARLGLT
jgi:uridine phosphorylase